MRFVYNKQSPNINVFVDHGGYWDGVYGSRISQMNAWGPQGCREHLDEIVGRLLDEAQRRGWRTAKLPGAHWAVKRLVNQAIHRAE